MPDRGDDPVVIVGLGIEAPGGIDTAEQYWSLLADGREALSAIPDDRDWAVRELIDESQRDGFKPICNIGGFLSGAAEFDPGFFGIAPREAVAMDPQQRSRCGSPGVRARTPGSTPTNSPATTSVSTSARR